jgi:two-component sensor histidine kinase
VPTSRMARSKVDVMAETSTDIEASQDSDIGIADGSISLVAELQHRVKNLFAVIHALAVHSLSGDSSLEEARRAFIGRLEALARADQRLLNSARMGTSLNELVRGELEPFADQVRVEGVDVTLNSSAARNFALALHELATNASKYGALSVPHGMAIVAWDIATDHGDRTLVLRWRECGGPHVSVPARSGFGTSLLKAVLGEARFDFAGDGFKFEVRLPLSTIVMHERMRDDRPLATTSDERQRQASSHLPASEGTAQLDLFDAGDVRAPISVPAADRAVSFSAGTVDAWVDEAFY